MTQDSDNPTHDRIWRSFTINGRRTTLSLEKVIWECLDEISHNEGISVANLCSLIVRRRSGLRLAATIRVFVAAYFRAAAPKWVSPHPVQPAKPVPPVPGAPLSELLQTAVNACGSGSDDDSALPHEQESETD